MILVQKSVAHPWMCDVLGHMTTRHYVAMFDDSSYHFLYTVFGWTGDWTTLDRTLQARIYRNLPYLPCLNARRLPLPAAASAAPREIKCLPRRAKSDSEPTK